MTLHLDAESLYLDIDYELMITHRMGLQKREKCSFAHPALTKREKIIIEFLAERINECLDKLYVEMSQSK